MPYGVDYGEAEKRLAIAIAEALGGNTGGGGTGGTVAVSNFPSTQNVAGTVNVGNFPSTQAVSGTVNINTIAKPTGIVNGQLTVPAAGTRQQFPSAVLRGVVTVKALPTNTGLIYVGNSTVSAGNGHVLSPRESVPIEIDNLNRIYIDAQVNGEGVSYLAS